MKVFLIETFLTLSIVIAVQAANIYDESIVNQETSVTPTPMNSQINETLLKEEPAVVTNLEESTQEEPRHLLLSTSTYTNEMVKDDNKDILKNVSPASRFSSPIESHSVSIVYTNSTQVKVQINIEVPHPCKNEPPSQYVQVGRKLLYFAKKQYTWNDAMIACKIQHNGVLASIDNKEDAKALSEYLLKQEGPKYIWWLSGYKFNGGDSNWNWSSSGKPFVDVNWHDLEPNNFKGENCVEVEFRRNAQIPYSLNDLNCNSRAYFICEPAEQFCCNK